MDALNWPLEFRRLSEQALSKFQAGIRDPAQLFTSLEVAWLASIGATPAELFDFAEDAASLPWETALLITAVRRDYFLLVQNGQHSTRRLSEPDLPLRKAAVAGMEWLTRLMAKARARLRGEMPIDVMYCCGGDRAFFKMHNIHPAEFLRLTWLAGENDGMIVSYVTKNRQL
jgi:hypothetical protein